MIVIITMMWMILTIIMTQSSKLVTDLQKEMKIIMMIVEIIMMWMILTIIIIRSSKRVTDLQRKLPGIQQKLSTIRGRDEQVQPVYLIIDLHNHYYH